MCKVEGCEKSTKKGGNGYCGMHWQRIKRTGNPGEAAPRWLLGMTAGERLMARAKLDPATGCLAFAGALRNGYSVVGVAPGRIEYGHRIVWESERGPIPAGMVIDHLCMNRACINIDHLDLVTRAENNRRGGLSHGERGKEVRKHGGLRYPCDFAQAAG